MAIDFRKAMKAEIANFETWADVKEKFKGRHRNRITYEFALPRDQWEIPPTNNHDWITDIRGYSMRATWIVQQIQLELD
jgi:hypothetical protein